jgi:glycosyltransferase involved in cell wall biosynthesis
MCVQSKDFPKVCFHQYEFTTYEDVLRLHIAERNINVYNVTFHSKKTYWKNAANIRLPTFTRIILDDEIDIPFSRGSEKFSPSFCRMLLQKGFDIVILPLGSFVSIFYSILAKLAGIAPVWYITVHTVPRTFVGLLRSLIIRTSLAISKDVVTLTDMHKRNLLRMGFPSERIIVIPHAVDTQMFSSTLADERLREGLGLNGRKVPLYVGRLTEEKGLYFLIQAMKLVVKEIHNVCLLIVGEGPLRESLQQLVHELELDDFVKIIKPVPPNEVPGFFSICDIHVAPSIATKQFTEPFGLVYLEAMASGKPSIAFDIPAPVRIIIGDEGTGYLVKEKNVGELADRICQLLANDPERVEMGMRAMRKCIREYSLEAIAQKWSMALRTIKSCTNPNGQVFLMGSIQTAGRTLEEE